MNSEFISSNGKDNWDFHQSDKLGLSSVSCKKACETTKVCPELVPYTCEKYKSKCCNCVTMCKDTLQFLSQFADDSQKKIIDSLHEGAANDKVSDDNAMIDIEW